MKTVKVNELSGAALDYAVAVAIGHNVEECFYGSYIRIHSGGHTVTFCPSTDWAHGGPIVEQEGIELKKGNPLYFPRGNEQGDYYEPLWLAGKQHGRTQLIAAMRCYVASKLGEEIELPNELMMRN